MSETTIHGTWIKARGAWEWSVEIGRDSLPWRDHRGRIRVFRTAEAASRAYRRHRERLAKPTPLGPRRG